MVTFVFYSSHFGCNVDKGQCGAALKLWETFGRSIIWDLVIDNRSHASYVKKKGI